MLDKRGTQFTGLRKACRFPGYFHNLARQLTSQAFGRAIPSEVARPRGNSPRDLPNIIISQAFAFAETRRALALRQIWRGHRLMLSMRRSQRDLKQFRRARGALTRLLRRFASRSDRGSSRATFEEERGHRLAFKGDFMLLHLMQFWPLGILAILAMAAFSGFVVIGQNQVGIVVKKFSGKSLPDGRFIAIQGEAGYQADTLAPGWYFRFWFWKFEVQKRPTVVIPQGEIGLVVAADGKPIPPNRLLGSVVDCDNFQNGRKFLEVGGEKGRQLAVLTAGTYRINTALFRVITCKNARENEMNPSDLLVHQVSADRVGIVTTLDGAPIEAGEIAGPFIEGHGNFQDPQTFIRHGGRRGLQEQVLLSGSWNLNPWFIRVEQVAMTEIPIGYVGVVISYVGKENRDISGAEFKHGNLVDPGHKGVWITPMHPGKHPLNTRVMKVELVPTTNIVLNWANRSEAHSYDSRLSSVTVRSTDGFAFTLDVSQVIHVGAGDAPKVISRVGSMQNLVDHVLEPLVGNYFRNSAQEFTVLDFLSARSERQKDAAAHIRGALLAYDVQAIDTLIGDINPPAQLMQTQMDRKLAEEQRLTYEVQQTAQKMRQELVRETAVADIQQEVVKAEKGVNIAELQARARVKTAEGDAESNRLNAAGEGDSLKLRAAGEAESIRATGNARAEAYVAGVQALGPQAYMSLQMMQVVGERGVRIVPDVAVNGGNGNPGIVDGLLGILLKTTDKKSER